MTPLDPADRPSLSDLPVSDLPAHRCPPRGRDGENVCPVCEAAHEAMSDAEWDAWLGTPAVTG